MGIQELKPSSVVGTEVKNIKRLKGSKKDIDDKLEYFRLGELLQDILNGKYDKNTIEQDAHYIKGLQIEYENRYGKPADEPQANKSEESKTSYPNETENKKADGTMRENPNSSDIGSEGNNEPSTQSTTSLEVKNKNSNNLNPNNEGVTVSDDDNFVVNQEESK